MTLLLKNGRVIDPANNIDSVTDLLIRDGRIAALGGEAATGGDITVLDAAGKWIMPGLIDLHTHLREPGQEHKETLATGAAAAARGGYTTILAMANTSPPVDDTQILEIIMAKAAEAPVNVLQLGAITRGMEGKTLCDYGAMRASGAAGFSEDGMSVMDAGLYREAMRQIAGNDLKVFAHCEDPSIAGAPGIAEDIIVARDILIAEETGAALHIQHVSTAKAVSMIKAAKRKGVRVTCEAAPHHLILCEEDIPGPDANYKMKPPLRPRCEMEALRKALADGTIDCVATDHAPHSQADKNRPYPLAANGVVGLETALPLMLTAFVHKGLLQPARLAEVMSHNPARILGIPKGTLTPGQAADITVIAPDAAHVIDVNSFLSKGRNSPFHGYHVRGMTAMTICGGRIIFKEQLCW